MKKQYREEFLRCINYDKKLKVGSKKEYTSVFNVVPEQFKKVADDLNAGAMEDRVAHIFMEADHIYVQDVLDVAPLFGKLKKSLRGV